METYRDKIDEIIDVNKNDNFIGHLSSAFFHKNKIVAEKQNELYKLWKSHQFSSIIYPVIKFKFNQEGEIVEINTEVNIVGKTLIGIYFFLGALFLGNLIYQGLIIQKDIISLIPITAIFLLLFGFYKVIGGSYKREKKYFINNIKVHLAIATEQELKNVENLKSEWTYNKLLMRFFIYPFSISILLMSFWAMFNGYYKGLLGIPICIAFLYSDIKLIVNKSKNT
jgi:hypothetical protein